jgi:hypothetical protein
MYRVKESVRIDRPPKEGWTSIADYSFDLQWRRGITEMTPDPLLLPLLRSGLQKDLKRFMALLEAV